MNIKRHLLFLFFICFYGQINGQFHELNVTQTKKTNQLSSLPYDSTENITHLNIRSLVGQQIKILPSPSAKSDGYYNNLRPYRDMNYYSSYKCNYNSIVGKIYNVVDIDSLIEEKQSHYRVNYYLKVKEVPNDEAWFLFIGYATGDISESGNINYYTSNISNDIITVSRYNYLRDSLIDSKVVALTDNTFNPVIRLLSDGSAPSPLPRHSIFNVNDIVLLNGTDHDGLAFILSSETIKDAYVLYQDFYYFVDYDTYLMYYPPLEVLKKKYGKKNGNLIFHNKIKIGFTKEMCQTAKGRPKHISYSYNGNSNYELWEYPLNEFLLFEGNKLVSIEHY